MAVQKIIVQKVEPEVKQILRITPNGLFLLLVGHFLSANQKSQFKAIIFKFERKKLKLVYFFKKKQY